MKKFLSVLLILALSTALLIPFGIVTVSADEPTLITDQAGLAAMTASGDYKLGSDITITGEWSYITPFMGTLDGDGHTITFADGATVIGGLFKQLIQGATVKNLNIVAGDVTWKTVADAAGSASPCVGGVAASVEAGYVNGTGKWSDTAFVSDPANVVTIQNITVTANIAISGTVARPNPPKPEDKVAGGGIIGEIGIIAMIKNCTFNGSISDAVNRTNIDMSAYESCYAGILGKAIRNGGPVAIIGCVNNGTISGYGQEGGILGYSLAWGGGDTGLQSLIIQNCINNGEINCLQTTVGSSTRATAGGIAGYVYVKDESVAIFKSNINYGKVNAIAAEGKIEAGICGVIRQKDTVKFEGNINLGEAKSQMIHTGLSNGKVSYVNNYAITGSDTEKYTTVESAKAAYDALNALYADTYTYDESEGKIGLATDSSGSSNLEVPQEMTLNVEVPEATGTAITSQKDFEAMASDGTYYLANDIEVIGTLKAIKNFSGTFHGNGHTIVLNGATVRGGLFNDLAGGKVYNLSITEAPGSGSKNNYRGISCASDICFGTIAGYGYGTIVGVTTDCAVGGSLKNTSNAYVGGVIGIVTDGNTVIYNSRNTGRIQGGYAGGIAGAIFCENGKVEISRCVNWGNTTATTGAAGGIFAVHSLKSMQVAMNLLAIGNVNYGAVTTGSSDCGGIAGSVVSLWEGKAALLCNVNYGEIKASAADIGCPGGIVGYIKYSGILIAGNVNAGNVEGTKAPNSLVAEVVGSGDLVAENNFAVEATIPATIGEIAGATIDANTVATLNGAYADTFAAGDQIALKWAADANLSATAPTVSYTVDLTEEEQGNGNENDNNNNNNNNTNVTPAPSETVTQAPAAQTETKKKGCGSAIGIGGVVALLMLCGAGVTVAVKRKED